MKRILFILALVPFTVFAQDKIAPNSYTFVDSKCDELVDSDERKDCLIITKKNEAEEHYKNLQENNHVQDKEEF